MLVRTNRYKSGSVSYILYLFVRAYHVTYGIQDIDFSSFRHTKIYQQTKTQNELIRSTRFYLLSNLSNLVKTERRKWPVEERVSSYQVTYSNRLGQFTSDVPWTSHLHSWGTASWRCKHRSVLPSLPQAWNHTSSRCRRTGSWFHLPQRIVQDW